MARRHLLVDYFDHVSRLDFGPVRSLFFDRPCPRQAEAPLFDTVLVHSTDNSLLRRRQSALKKFRQGMLTLILHTRLY